MSDQKTPEIPRAVAEKLAAEGDHAVAKMLRLGMPLSRDVYLLVAGIEPDPEEGGGLTAEQEMHIPEPFRDTQEEQPP